MAGVRTIDDVLAGARGRIRRYSPEAALAAARRGAVLIDTRSSDDMEREGRIPGSIYIHRNVLEWRCDPSSGYSDPRVSNREARLIIVCNDGYASSLAAASLIELGFSDAGDLEGGFRSWAKAGLPVEPYNQRNSFPIVRPLLWLSRAVERFKSGALS
jgi:rhodanese-related sulfurtransferase